MRVNKLKQTRQWVLCGAMALSTVATVVFGFMSNEWFWAFALLLVAVIVIWIVISVIKESINEGYRATHFLLAVACRAHNNKDFLVNGVELRPGFLGKFIEVNALQTRSRNNYLRMYHERVKDQDIGAEEDRESEELSRYKLEQKIKEEQRVKEEQRRTLYPSKTVQNSAAQSSIVERRMTAQPR